MEEIRKLFLESDRLNGLVLGFRFYAGLREYSLYDKQGNILGAIVNGRNLIKSPLDLIANLESLLELE